MAPVDERKVYAFFAAFRFAFLSPARASSFSAGDALNRTVAPAFTATFSPVLGLRAKRFGVSRTVNEPKSGKVNRPGGDDFGLDGFDDLGSELAGGEGGHLSGLLDDVGEELL